MDISKSSRLSIMWGTKNAVSAMRLTIHSITPSFSRCGCGYFASTSVTAFEMRQSCVQTLSLTTCALSYWDFYMPNFPLGYKLLPVTRYIWFVFKLFAFIYFFKDFIYLFLERGEGREGGRETSMCGCLSRAPFLGGTWPATQACALDWESKNRTGNTLVCRPTLNPPSYASQG